ncbi:MAG: hypothetical protein NTU91_04850 [Chloroflexi bacterium]|nr:hypothetical protein [Chloroflexota bacterium]
MSRQPWLRQGRWWALALLVVLAACGPKAADDLSSTDDLAAMLRQAGATVQEADEPVPEAFDAQVVRALRVNEGVVYVYEYGSVAEVEAISAGIGPQAAGMPWEGRVSAWPAGKLLVVYPGTDGGLLSLLNGLLGDPLTASPEGPEEPYPPAVAAAISVWAEAQGVDPATVEVVSYTAAEWMNGCLGLPGPGESCVPGAVSGWMVDLQAGDRLGSAHTDDLGLQVRLTSPD